MKTKNDAEGATEQGEGQRPAKPPEERFGSKPLFLKILTLPRDPWALRPELISVAALNARAESFRRRK